MLVLTRKPREQILIGDQVTITVTRIKGNTIQLGIEAPQEIKILRGELVAKQVIELGGEEDLGFAWPVDAQEEDPELDCDDWQPASRTDASQPRNVRAGNLAIAPVV